ncbi:MAG: RNA methyltransferase [Candidatus Pseudobacter hemicellulosilyticus]|uniref:RNA methyltransferase n=1 Tax=Candidatus Pseudobacter hemicellulosilyticus TaxID=3121375 RepID=A0AAJ6BF86_9BACT|nr:MAG: RNA methyltransferase [Pseudobacter sp.]
MLVKSQVKYIQSLSQKKLRDEEGLFVGEGPKIINELLSAGNVHLQQLYALPEWISQQPATIAERCMAVDPDELGRLSFQQHPNQVLGVFRKPEFAPERDWGKGLHVVLDTLQDPGNMGTILRCADWFGINAMVCSPDSADIFNPKVVQASMGGISRVEVIYTDLPAFLRAHSGIPVLAATLDGTPLPAMTGGAKGFLLIGNESRGISDELLALATHRVTIPRKGQAESLNAAVATGILLSHLTV